MKKIVLCLVCVLSLSSAKVDMNKPVPLEKSLKISVEVMNQSLPEMIDAELRHDKVESEGKSLIFKYTLVNFTEAQMPAKKLKELMFEDTKKSVCSDAETQIMFQKGMRVIYDYADKNKKPITQFIFDTKACGLKTDGDKLKDLLNLVKTKEVK